MAYGKSLGLPPLGGIATYQEAARSGLAVEQNVRLLKRYAYVERRLMEMSIAHLCAVPEWEVKCALALHCWLDAEHATVFRDRVAEMREPPLHLDAVPDDRLAAFLDEALHARDTIELLVGLYRVVKPALIDAYRRHLAESNPLADHPTCRHLRLLVVEEQDMIAWGEAALAALTVDASAAEHAACWRDHLHAYLCAARGIWGDDAAGDGVLPTLPPPRATVPFVVDLVPRRDERFSDVYNFGGFVDAVAYDTTRSPHERTLALMFKRLREMDVPEWMATIIAQTPDKPWPYYVEMARQLWDEARHAMMGEVGFESVGVDWTALPVPIANSYAINTRLSPLERHAVLYDIEQHLMRRETGKRYEWETAVAVGNPLLANFQDYDWADEVLHTQIGRRWLVPELGSRDAVGRCAEGARVKLQEAYAGEPQLRQDTKTNWWSAFYATMQRREGRG
jgi:hypothetical protein